MYDLRFFAVFQMFFIARSYLRLSFCGACIALSIAMLSQLSAQELSVNGTLPEDSIPQLKVLIEQALHQSPDMILRELDVSVSDAQRLYSGIAPLLPNVSAGGNYGVTRSGVSITSFVGGSAIGTSYGISINQPLFHWGALRNQLQFQTISALISRKQYTLGYLGFIGMVRSQYLGLIDEKLRLRNILFELEIRQKALSLAQQKLQNGIISANEIAGPEIEYETASLNADRERLAYDFARHALARQTGVADIADDSIPDEIPLPHYSEPVSKKILSDLLNEKASATLDMQIASLGVEQAKLMYKINRVQQLPMVGLQAGLNQNNIINVQNNTISQSFVLQEQYAVTVGWNIFDGFASHGRKREAFLKERQSEIALSKKTDEILSQAQMKERGVSFSWRALSISEKRYAIAKGAYNQMSNELKIGNISEDSAGIQKASFFANQIATYSTRGDFYNTWCDYLSFVYADPTLKLIPASYARIKP
jgi:outer membrane protein TolC